MNRRSEVLVTCDEEVATERCRLRYPVATDIPDIWSASQTPNFNDGLAWDPPSSMEEIKGPLRRAQESWVSGEEYSWAIESKDSRDFVGWISIRREPGDRKWSIGFWVHPAKQGQGFAKECAAAILDFGFSRLEAKVITATHAAWNSASSRVLRQIGMKPVREDRNGLDNDHEWIEYEVRAD